MGRKPVGRDIIQLRVSPKEFEILKKAAETSGRSVPAEVRHRLALTDFRPNQAIGDLATIIAERADDALYQLFGPAEEWLPDTTQEDADEGRRRDWLATTREALVKVLNDLGASEQPPASDQMTPAELVTGITWDLATRAKTRTGKDDAEGRILARIGEALGFRKPANKPTKGTKT